MFLQPVYKYIKAFAVKLERKTIKSENQKQDLCSLSIVPRQHGGTVVSTAASQQGCSIYVELTCSPEIVGVLSGYSSYLAQSKTSEC